MENEIKYLRKLSTDTLVKGFHNLNNSLKFKKWTWMQECRMKIMQGYIDEILYERGIEIE